MGLFFSAPALLTGLGLEKGVPRSFEDVAISGVAIYESESLLILAGRGQPNLNKPKQF